MSFTQPLALLRRLDSMAVTPWQYIVLDDIVLSEVHQEFLKGWWVWQDEMMQSPMAWHYLGSFSHLYLSDSQFMTRWRTIALLHSLQGSKFLSSWCGLTFSAVWRFGHHNIRRPWKHQSIHKRAMKMVNGLEGKLCEEWLKSLVDAKTHGREGCDMR